MSGAAPTANLQAKITVRELAMMMNISERSIYSARRLQRMGRPDLEAECAAGRMSMTEDERAIFYAMVEIAAESEDPAP